MARKSKYAEEIKKKSATYNTAMYIRLSREDGDKVESESIGNQRNIIQTFIDNRREFKLVDEYVDDNFSGSNFNRPDFKRMLVDIQSGKINCIIVKDLSRFGRDFIDVGNYIQKIFPKQNVRFIAINDAVDSANTENTDFLQISFKNIFNEHQCRDSSRKVIDILRNKQSRGDFIGGFACYGYLKNPEDKHKLIIDEYAAIIVRRVFSEFLSGKGKQSIARILNDESVLCPTEYKRQSGLKYSNGNKLAQTKNWTYATIHRMLSNEMYIGNMVQHKNNRSKYRIGSVQLDKKEWIIVPNTHEPIIDKHTWMLAQDLLQRNTRVIDFNNNVSLFAGFCKCNDCGRSMVRVKRYKTVEYVCDSYKRYGVKICTSHVISEAVLAEILLAEIQSYIHYAIASHGVLEQLDGSKKAQREMKSVQDNISRLQRDIDKVYRLKKASYEDYKLGDISKKDYMRYKEDYETQERNIETQLELLNSKVDGQIEAVNVDWIKDFQAYKNIRTLDRDVLAAFVEQVYVHNDKTIEIVYKYQAEVEMLAEISGVAK